MKIPEFSNMRVFFEKEWGTDNWKLFVLEKSGDRAWMARPAQLVMEQIEDFVPGASAKAREPFLSLPRFLLGPLTKALSEIGFRDRLEEDELKSVLKVKDDHLQDMRHLVFGGPIGEYKKPEK